MGAALCAGAGIGLFDSLRAVTWQSIVGDEAKHVEFFGNLSDNNAATRSNGFNTVLSQYPGLEKVAEELANWDRTQGYNRMQSIMQAHPQIDAVISGNHEMVLGAIAALKEPGRLEGTIIGGFDASPDAVDAIRAGEMAHTVLQPVFVFSREAVILADCFIRNRTSMVDEEKQLFDRLLITPYNLDQYTAPFTLSN